MKNKGFTLIELLAVIVILAIIATIATPIILGIINDAKEKAFKLSLKSVEHAYELYSVQNNIPEGTIVDIKDLPLDKKNLTGKVVMNKEGKLELKDITDGTFSALGTTDDIVMIKGPVDDLYKDLLDIKVNTNTSSRSVVITVETIDGIPTSYKYKIEGPDNYTKESNEITDNKYTFNKLKLNQNYKVTVIAKNKSGKTRIKTKDITTLSVDNISLDLNPKDEYINEGKVTINYPTIEEGLINYYKWNDDKDFTPVTENSVEVEAKNGTLIAVIKDGEETVLSNQITINNIDNIPPQITISNIVKNTNSITIPFTVVEDNIKEITCKYGEESNNLNKEGIVQNNICTISNLSNNKDYYYEICVTDIVDNKTCVPEEKTPIKTDDFTAPSIEITNAPEEVVNGYVLSEVAHITFTTLTEGSYYIKTTLSGETNVNVIGSCSEEKNKPINCNTTQTKNLQANTWYKVNGDINITYNPTTSVNTNHSVYATTFDEYNYKDGITATLLKIDKDKPSIEIVTNGNNTVSKTHSSVVNVTDDKSGINTLKYKWTTNSNDTASNGTVFTTGNTLTTPNNLNGNYYLCIYTKDNLGNEKNQCSNVFKLDNTGPTITFGTNGNSTFAKTQSSKITVTNDTYGATLNTSSYKYIFSTNNKATPNTSFTSGSTYTLDSGDGNYYLIAKACDSLGNCTTKTSNVFKLDNTAPIISSATASDKTITITASDNIGGSEIAGYSFDNGSTWQISNTKTVSSCGTYTVKVKDTVGNISDGKSVDVVALEPAPDDTKGLLGIIYYNPETGSKCTNSEYNMNLQSYGQSTPTGLKTGCMKWYVYAEDATTYTMILDHNTTASSSNLTQDTSSWKVSARLITAEEVASITGNTSWNKFTASYYLDSNSNKQIATSKGASKYYWLYDYTNDCEIAGCKVQDNATNSDSVIITGYFLDSNYYLSDDEIWGTNLISAKGCLSYVRICYGPTCGYGTRPVITIAKSQF